MAAQRKFIAAGNLLQAHSWKGMLEACGIEVEIRGEALLGGIGELPANLLDVELWVSETQYDQAKTQFELLNEERPSWQCSQCKEVNEGNFELCWRCANERPEPQS